MPNWKENVNHKSQCLSPSKLHLFFWWPPAPFRNPLSTGWLWHVVWMAPCPGWFSACPKTHHHILCTIEWGMWGYVHISYIYDYIYIHIWLYIYIHDYTYIYDYIHKYLYKYIHDYTHIHIYTYDYIYIYILLTYHNNTELVNTTGMWLVKLTCIFDQDSAYRSQQMRRHVWWWM